MPFFSNSVIPLSETLFQITAPLKQILVCHYSLQSRHNEQDGVSNHQPRNCLQNLLFRRKSKKTPKLRDTGLCMRNSPMTGEFPYKEPVTRKMLPFDGVIMFMVQWNIEMAWLSSLVGMDISICGNHALKHITGQFYGMRTIFGNRHLIGIGMEANRNSHKI